MDARLLIEHRNGRFAVRERSEIERLLSRAYRAELPLERLMAGLTAVASASHGEVQVKGVVLG